MLLFFVITGLGQKPLNVFRRFGYAEDDSFRLTKPLRFYEILCSKTGQHKFTSSFGLVRDKGMQIEIIFYTWGDDKTKKLSRNYAGEDSIISMHESTGNIVFFASHDSRIYWQPGDDGGTGFTPFNFPPTNKPNLKVSKIWIDTESNIYIGTYEDNLYFIARGATMSAYDGVLDSAGNFRVMKGERPVRKIVLSPNTTVYSFAQDLIDPTKIWIGTNNGLFLFDNATLRGKNILKIDKNNDPLTITHIEPDSIGNVWFSTLEKGMGLYMNRTASVNFFSDKKQYPVNTFCRKSANEFFTAVLDSVPAIFDATTGKYSFIQDSIFSKTADSTYDIKLDGFGNLLVVKGGGLFYTDFYKESKPFAFVPVEKKAYAPFITEIMVMGAPLQGRRQSQGVEKYTAKT